MLSPFCPKCKYKLGTGSSICPICATDISDSSSFKNNEPKELDKRIYDVHFGQRTTIKKVTPIKEKNKSLMLLGIAGIIIIVLIVMLFVFL